MTQMNKTGVRWLCGVLLALLFLGGCASESEQLVEETSFLPTAVPTQTPPPLTPSPSPTLPLPTVTLTAATLTAVPPTAVPPTPTATPNPPIIVAVPPEWETAVANAIAALNQPQQPWQTVINDDPAAAIADGSAQIALVESGPESTDEENGTAVYAEPIALAVPFTTHWEYITLIDARHVLTSGHEIVTALPWHEMTPDMKALQVDGIRPDDPAYPLQIQLFVSGAPGMETAVAQLTPLLQEHLKPEPVVLLTAVGDIMMDRGLGYNISQGHLVYPFAKVADILQAADIAVGNVESAMGTVGEPAPKAYPFRAPPEAAQALAIGGFDLVSLANNHGMDYGPETLLEALDLLKAANVQTIGAGADRTAAHTPYITEINGLKLAFLGYVNVPVEASTAFDVAVWDAAETTPGLAWGEPEIVAEDVTAVKDQVDLVIVVLHSGYEYVEEPSEEQAAIAHAAIDAGAKLVIGHHAHILQGIEYYNGGTIVYGLGNFAFEIDGDPSTVLLNVWLDKDGARELEIIPAVIQFGGQPRPLEEWEEFPALERIYYLTKILNGY